ncbi:MAG: SxtJ family membrane protein [Bacteroidia bacterium]
MKPQDTYKTILVISTGLLLFYWWKDNIYWLYACLAINILCVFFPIVAHWINKFWFKLATILGWINARILLTIIFFLVLFPVALLRRLLHSKKNISPASQSFYVVRNHLFTAKDMENPW